MVISYNCHVLILFVLTWRFHVQIFFNFDLFHFSNNFTVKKCVNCFRTFDKTQKFVTMKKGELRQHVYTNIIHQSKAGMQKCTVLDISNYSFNPCLASMLPVAFFNTFPILVYIPFLHNEIIYILCVCCIVILLHASFTP